jgi:hypothetical protein
MRQKGSLSLNDAVTEESLQGNSAAFGNLKPIGLQGLLSTCRPVAYLATCQVMTYKLISKWVLNYGALQG